VSYRRVQWISLLLGMAVLLSGCSISKAVEQPPEPSEVKQDDIMSPKERDMVILFQGLVQMDKKDGLMLTKQQAEAMLPLVRRNSTDGELSQSDQQQIVGLLTLKQRAYVDEFQEHLQNRKQSFTDKKPWEELTPEQREQMIKDFQDRRQEREKEHLDPQDPGNAQAPAGPGSLEADDGELLTGGDADVPDNVEQQLMDLLEGRLSPNMKK